MTGNSRVTMHKGVAAAIGLALLLAGAGGAYLLMRSRAETGPQSGGMPTDPTTTRPSSGTQSQAAGTAADNAPLPDVMVTLTTDAVERAGVVVTPVALGASAAEIRLPGIIEPNAYRQVTVTPLVAGRVTRVPVELGARVRRGQTLAQIFSPELAEAQTKYVSAKAMLDAHDQELQRTQQLIKIGAASRQELERIHAAHAAQTAAVQSARSQLELFGVQTSTVDALGAGAKVNATTSVPAPIDGILTERTANVGLNVDPATKLFTVVDLSTVWIVADVHETDFSRVRVGSETTISTAAYPGRSLRGRVTYIDPQLNTQTRTAKVRVEVANPRGELRLGMFADVVVTGEPGASVPIIPRAAIQSVGDRTVVYLVDPNEPGQFTEREVRLGHTSGEQVEVVSGIQAGDVVVTDGSFLVRAERERRGLRPAAATGGRRAPPPVAGASANVQTAKVVVNEQGFEPAQISLPAGERARITFVRTTDKTCATEVVFPSLNIKRQLPLYQPVDIELTPPKAGVIAFVCGMNMRRGSVIVD